MLLESFSFYLNLLTCTSVTPAYCKLILIFLSEKVTSLCKAGSSDVVSRYYWFMLISLTRQELGAVKGLYFYACF